MTATDNPPQPRARSLWAHHQEREMGQYFALIISNDHPQRGLKGHLDARSLRAAVREARARFAPILRQNDALRIEGATAAEGDYLTFATADKKLGRGVYRK